MFKKCVTYLNIFSFCWPSFCMAGMINPDGKTMTNVAVNGSTYDVTTGTISGKNAFNSFSSFDVYKGSTANLHLPDGTANLINLIHEKGTNIDGVLNAYKNGQIGGNVFMLNPNGIVVGESGVVNVGSIAMSTPTHYFMQQVVQNGSVSETATKAILAGDMPINKSGTVSVKGKIKALDKIAIQAGSFENRGELTTQTNLSDLVNMGDLNLEDQPLVFNKGKIAIASETDIVNAGKVEIKGKSGQKTGKVSVEAKKDIHLENGSVIAANGTGKSSEGGEIYIMAQNNASFEKGAVLEAKGGESGNGGFIELSAQKKVLLNGGSFDASAKNGQAGQVYIDPDEVEVNSQTSANANITVDGRIITIKDKAVLDAKTNDIKITAINKDGVGIAGITVGEGAELKGKNIDLKATSSMTASKFGLSEDNYNADLFGIGDLSLALFAGVANISSTAYIDVKKSAKLIATENVNLDVESEAKINTMAGFTLASAAFGAVENAARLTVADGVLIQGRNVNLTSVAKSSLSLSAMTLASGDSRLLSGASGSFAMAQLKSNNKIDIGNATIKATDKLKIEARTDKAMSVSASTFGLIESSGAIDVAISTSKVTNTVAVGGTIEGKDILVNSEIYSVAKSSASGNAGQGDFMTEMLSMVQGWVPNKLAQLVTRSGGKISEKGEAKQAGKNEGTKAKIKVAGSVSYVDHENTAEAYIKDNATVKASHDLDVNAKIYDAVVNVASASVSGGTQGDNQSSNGISAAVGIADFNNTARAYIGKNATVDVNHRLNVHAQTVMPPKYTSEGSTYFKIQEMLAKANGNFWNDFLAGATTVWEIAFDKASANLGIKHDFFNTWAQSGVDLTNPDDSDQKFAITGSVNLVDYNNSSVAFIDEGARINQNNAQKAGSRVVDVNATTDVMGVNMGGFFGLPAGLQSQQGAGIGASFVMANYNNTTGAFIGDNVKLNAEGLNVSADLLNQNVSLAIGYGKSENIGLQGMFNFMETQNTTVAQVSGGAQVTILGNGLTGYTDSSGKSYKDTFGKDKDYSRVNINAKDDSLFVNVSGDMIQKKGGKSVVAATTVTNVNRTTHAVWGDIQKELLSTTAYNQLARLLKRDSVVLYDLEKIGNQNGFLSSEQDVKVEAVGSGMNVALSIAASASTDEKAPDAEDFDPNKVKVDNLANNVADMGAQDAQQKNQFGMGISASFAWNKLDNDVAAYSNNARAPQIGNISLVASDSTQSYAVTGGVSVEAAKGDSNFAAAASASYNNINSTVRAFGNNVVLNSTGNIKLSADNHTKMMALAIGTAVSTQATSGLTLNGTVTVNDINNITQAYFKNSTLIADSVDLAAIDDSWLLQIGLGISASKNANGGAVAGWNTSSGKTQAALQDTAVTSDTLTLKARNAMDIRSISTGGTASKAGSVGLTGAYNDISNTTQAVIQNTAGNSSTITAKNIVLDSRDDSDIIAVSTGASFGKKFGANIVVGVNRIKNVTQSLLIGTRILTATGISPIVAVNAVLRGRIRSFANSVGAGESAGIGNTGTYNDIYNTVEAKVSNSTITGDSLSLNATDMSYILSETAGVGISKSVGTGLAVSINRIGNQARAVLENSNVTVSKDVQLGAYNLPSDREIEDDLPSQAGDMGDTSKRSITTITVGAGVGNYGGGLSGSYADVQNTTESQIIGGVTTAQNVSLNAQDNAHILTIGVAAGGGQTAGVGGVSVTNKIANKVNALIGDVADKILTKITTNGNIRAEAQTKSVLQSIAAGAGGGGTAGVAGIIAYNDISNTVSAQIRKAVLSSVGSIALLAKAMDTAQFYYGMVAGGGTFGGGGVIGLNYLGNKAEALVDNATISSVGKTALEGHKGLLVNADVDDEVSVYGGSAAGGGTVGVSGNVGFVQVGNEATAKINNATISSNVIGQTADAQSGVAVLANNDVDVNIMSGNVAGGGNIGVGASAGTAVIKNITQASVSKSDVDMQGDVTVKANSVTHYNSVIVTGAGGGTVGAVGSVGVGLIANQTTALVDETMLETKGDLIVDSTSYTGLGKKGLPSDVAGTSDNVLAVGGVAGAGVAGVGVSVMVNQVNNSTTAIIKNSSVEVKKQTSVQAKNTDEASAYVVTGGIGGYAGVGGSTSVNNFNSTVSAGIESDKVNLTRNGKTSQVVVNADTIKVDAKNTGKVSVLMTTLGASGVAGVGAGIDVSTIKGDASAYIKGNMPITTKNDITVNALNTKEGDITVITGGAAGIAGVSGAISVLNLGNGSYNSSEYTSGTSSESGSKIGVDEMIADQLTANKEALKAAQNQDLMMTQNVQDTNIRKDDSLQVQIDSVEGKQNNVRGAVVPNKSAVAFVDLKGNTLTSQNGSIAVNATENIKSKQFVGGASAGAFAAVGASIAVSNVNTNTLSKIQNTIVSAGKNVSVNALLNQDIKSEAFAAAGTGLGAINGAVSSSTVHNITESVLGRGVNIQQANDLLIRAKSNSVVHNQTDGATLAGIAGIGASVATAFKSGETNAFIDEGVLIGTESSQDRVNNVTVSAENESSVEAVAHAATGGILGSVNGTVATASLTDSQRASIKKNTKMNLVDSLMVQTNASQSSKAKTLGVNVGALAVGASVSTTNMTLDNKAELEDNIQIRAKNTRVMAYQSKAELLSNALAAAGALIGLNGSVSSASLKGSVSTVIGRGLSLVLDGLALFDSKVVSSIRSKASGYQVGLIAGGATVASVNNNVETQTTLKDGQLILADSLTVNAIADTTQLAEAVSGSGGVVSGAAAVSRTSNTSTTKVKIGQTDNGLTAENNIYDLGKLTVKAQSNVNQNAFSDSINAALVGASGASVENKSYSTVGVHFAGTNKIEANDVLIDSLNNYKKQSDDLNVNSGSGGVVDAPAALSKTNTTHVTTVDFEKGMLLVRNQGRTTFNQLGKYDFKVNALNSIIASDKVKLVSGAAIPLAFVVSEIVDNSTAEINVNGANLVSAGDMILNAAGNIDIKTDAAASTYGLASVASGSTRSETTQNNTITVKDNASIFSNGNLYLNAGQAKSVESQKANVTALTQLWNNTVVPISDNDAIARLNYNNLIDIQSGSGIKSGLDAFVTSQQSNYNVVGQADSHNPYNAAFSTNVSTYDGKVNNNSKINVFGSIDAGVNNVKKILINADGTITVNGSTDGAGFYYRAKNELVYDEMEQQLTLLKQMRADYGQNKEYYDYYTAEIGALELKMKSMGLLVEHKDETGKVIGTEIRKNISTDYLEIYDLYAGAGAVELVTDKLVGGENGSISVTSGAEISIENNSNKFLEINDLIINERPSGTVRLNYQVVNKASDLGVDYKGSVKLNEGAVQNQTISISSNYQGVADNGVVMAPSIDISGNVSNYNGLVDIRNKSGSIYTSGAVRGKDIKISSGGDIIQKSNEFVYHIGGDPSSAWSGTATGHENGSQSGAVKNDTANYNSSIIASNNIYISGRYLDLNGLIQSGTADWKLNITDNNLSLIGSGGNKLSIDNAKTDYQNRIKTDSSASSLYALSKDAHGNVNAYYNVLTEQIEIDDVRVQGGYIELNGHIMNTSSKGGELRAADGYGRLNVNNNSSFDIVLNDVALGEKINGIIKITDTAQTGKDGKSLVTTYTRNGNTITKETNGGELSHISANINGDGISDTTYDVLGGQRYQWLTGLEHLTEKETTYNTKTFWGWDGIAPDEDDSILSHTWNKSATPLREGETVKLGQNTDNAYDFSKSTVDLTNWNEVKREQWTETNGWWIFSTEDHYTRIVEQKGSKTYFEHSVKADNDVKISFQGFDRASTNILSKSSILLKGDVSNATGTASLTSQSGQIDSLSGMSQISAKDISLTAQTGIGDKNGIGVNLLGGQLTAVNNISGDINLNSSRDIVFDTIQNLGGNTSVHSKQNLLGVNAGSLIQGKSVDLSATYGKITTKDGKAFLVQTDSAKGGTISAFSTGDILLKQSNGDLGVKRIVSESGNVSLDIKGSVYDANEEQQANLQTQEEMKRRWDNMGLTSLSGIALEDAITAFENQKTGEYQQYWSIRHQLDESGNFKFTDTQKQAFQDAGMTVDEITKAETQKMNLFSELSAKYADTTYSSDYKYVASVADKEILAQGSGWNKSQLEYTFTASKLDASSGSQLQAEEANIEAQHVTITAGGSIGKDNGKLVLNLEDMEHWTDEQKLAFSAAERDNVSVSEDNKTVTISLREDLDVHAKSSINLKASEFVYLGAEQDIKIDQIQAGLGKDITIAGAGGIYNVAITDKANIIGKDLVLEAAKGSIGTTDKELFVDLTGKINARASNSVYLSALNGINKDLAIDYIYAPEHVSLKAQKIMDVRNDNLVNIRSHQIILNADSVGANENALGIALDGKVGALLTVNAQKDAFINNAESTDLAVNITAQNATITAKAGNIDIKQMQTTQNAIVSADNGNMRVDSIVAGNNAVLTVGNGNLTAQTINTGNNASLVVSKKGDMVVDSLTAQNTVTLTSVAGKMTLGSIISKAASVTVEALSGAVGIDSIVAKISATVKALAGNVYIDKITATNADTTIMVGTGALKADTITAGNNATVSVESGDMTLGSVTATNADATIMVGTGALKADTIAAGNNAAVSVIDGQTSVDTITAGNNATVSVESGDMTLGSVTATNADATIMVGTGALKADTIAAGNNAAVSVIDGQTSVDTITAGNNATVSVESGDMILGSVTATNADTTIMVGTGALKADTITAGNNAAVSVIDGQTSVDTITAGNNATVSVESGDMTLGSVTATNADATIMVGTGALKADTIAAGNDILLNNQTGTVSLGLLTAGHDILSDMGNGLLSIDKAVAKNDIVVKNNVGNVTVIDMTAGANVSFNVQAGDVLFGHVAAKNGQINASIELGSVAGLTDGITLTAKEINFDSIGGQIGHSDRVMNIQADKVNAFAKSNVYLRLQALDNDATESTFGTIESKMGNISLMAQNADAGLTGEIRAHQGHVALTAGGSIIDHLQSAEGTVQSNTMSFVSLNGSIGSQDRYVKVDSSYTQAGWIDAMADQGIYIDEVNGDMNVRRFISQNGDINLKIDAGIQGIDIQEGDAHFSANNITLHSNKGSIGTKGHELILRTNDTLPGFINLKAAEGIAFRKTTPNLWSDYLTVTKTGKIIAFLPTGMARVSSLYAKDGYEFIFNDLGSYSNVWIGKADLENKVVDNESFREPLKVDIYEMQKPFFNRYKIRYTDEDGNEKDQEEWLNGLLSFLQENNK